MRERGAMKAILDQKSKVKVVHHICRALVSLTDIRFIFFNTLIHILACPLPQIYVLLMQSPLCEGGRVKALCLSAVIRGVNSLTVLWNLATPTGFRKRGIQGERKGQHFDVF